MLHATMQKLMVVIALILMPTFCRSVVNMPRVTALSAHYIKQLDCFQIAIEADNGNTYLGRHYVESLRDLISIIAEDIKELERTEPKVGDQNCM